ncbi:MAG: Lrp/AsnC ligand binding domain-containing protein [Bacteroidota bacterium]
MVQNQFDHLDLEILGALTANARMAFSQLAEQLKVSNSLVHQRVNKMREAGVLKSPIFPVRPGEMGFETCAFTQIMVTNARFVDSVVSVLEQIPEIVECNNIAGRYAIMVKVYARNNSHLRDVLYEKIQPIEGVEETHTIISFETVFSRPVPMALPQPQ